MFGKCSESGGVPFPWVVVPAKMFGNVRKCSELVRPLHQPSPRAGHTSPRANTENLQKLKDPAPA